MIDHHAPRSGGRLTWWNFGEAEQRLASIRTFNEGNGDAFNPLLRKALAWTTATVGLPHK